MPRRDAVSEQFMALVRRVDRHAEPIRYHRGALSKWPRLDDRGRLQA